MHPTHYGRICPIETPEGPNIGLIASLSTFARVNEYGFVETPYRRVAEGKITDEVAWYSALEEEGKYIAQASANVDEKGKFQRVARQRAPQRRLPHGHARHDPADGRRAEPDGQRRRGARALPRARRREPRAHGREHAAPGRPAHPQPRAVRRHGHGGQARPRLRASAPSRAATAPSRASTPTRIVVRPESDKPEIPDIYPLMKFQRSNQSTCYNQTPIVRAGDRVKAGDVLADGPSTDMGELAMGQNVLVAFMPWQGFNFEDSILVSERIAKDDVFTSIHIEEYECVARDTKLGKEEVTRDIPNVGEEALKDLDESGIVRIGAEVKPGDILVGKITPKGETQLSPEEKLLRAIFGEKAGDVRDSSLRVPAGRERHRHQRPRLLPQGHREGRAVASDIEDHERDRASRRCATRRSRSSATRSTGRSRSSSSGTTTPGKLVDDKGKVLLQKGADIDEETLETVPRKYWTELPVEGAEEIAQKVRELEEIVTLREEHFRDKIDRLTQGRRAAPGRDQDGEGLHRHQAQAPGRRQDGRTPRQQGRHLAHPAGRGHAVPAGRHAGRHRAQPARRSEPHERRPDPRDAPGLGRARAGRSAPVHARGEVRRERDARPHQEDLRRRRGHREVAQQAQRGRRPAAWPTKLKRGIHYASPVFDGAQEIADQEHPRARRSPTSGQTVLFDGRTGDAFDQEVTVGVMYMLKLHHLVDDKIHARSIGPYSLVTQQPLGGKAQFGGQRLGEMEVWAMEAYGTAYALQEFLTVKSDDVQGRTRMYEAIVKGEYNLEPGLPESFNVLIKELQALCLNVELIEPGAMRTRARRGRVEAQEDREDQEGPTS